MADFLKKYEYDCPCCGSDEDVERTDWDSDGIFLIYTMYCPYCDVEWKEYFKVQYDGYTYQDKEFDSDGKEVIID